MMLCYLSRLQGSISDLEKAGRESNVENIISKAREEG